MRTKCKGCNKKFVESEASIFYQCCDAHYCLECARKQGEEHEDSD